MNSTEIDDLLTSCKHPQAAKDYREKYGRTTAEGHQIVAKAMSELIKQVEAGNVAVVKTEATKKQKVAMADVRGLGLPSFVEKTLKRMYHAAIKAADCELKKILEDV